VLLLGGLLSALAYTVLAFHSLWQLLFLASVPLFLHNALAIKNKPSQDLDPYLRQMALSTLIFVILFGTGLILS
jgi:1,4-dihydroxy-2-naphthoate octaprenyltransferase